MGPKVSIIITSYCPESKKYLDECVLSALNLNYKNREIIIVGRPDYMPMYEGCRTVSPPQKEFWNCTGLNYGVLSASADSEYYFLINDDVVLRPDCLEPLLRALQISVIGQVMPAGNDQQGRFYNSRLFDKYKILSPYFNAPEQCLIFADTLCLYAQLISKRVWQDVGPFDENLKGQDDIDYSLRVRQKGYLNAIELSSLVWHYGGVSAAMTLNDEKRVKSKEIFNKKWEGIFQI